MAVWIDEDGVLVRPAESATIVRSPLRDMEIPADLPERMKIGLTEVKKIPDVAEAYRAAIVDWVANGAQSPYSLTPDEVIARSQPRPAAHAEAAACFEMGQHLFGLEGMDAAMPWWKRAHELHRENWTYKRQAWTLVSTPEGEPSDMTQEVSEAFGTTWLDDVLALGGGEAYGVVPQL